MKVTARSAALCSITFAGLLALSACGKNEQQPANQPAAPSTAPAAASTAAHPATSTTAAAPAHAATAAAPAPASTAAAATAPAPAAAEGFQVSSITVGDAITTDHKVKKEVASFAPGQKTIYVSVDTTGSTPGATLNAKWTYLDKNQTIVSTSQSIIADGPSTTTFSMKNPDLWPEGKYKVDVSLDGKQVASKTFEVKKG